MVGHEIAIGGGVAGDDDDIGVGGVVGDDGGGGEGGLQHELAGGSGLSQKYAVHSVEC